MVIDASVMADFLLGRPLTLESLERELSGHEHESLHAPELIDPETLNALRKLVLTGGIAEARASEAAADLADMRLIRHPNAPLSPRVWELRHELTAYDATYLALAEALGDCLLLTGDGGLAARAGRSLGASRVRHIA